MWGHDSEVAEGNIRNFTGEWTGDGTITGSGNQEKMVLELNDQMESPTWNTGVMMVEILRDEYLSGSGSITIEYKTGDTVGTCEAQSYTAYTAPFRSDGYVKVRVTGT